MSNVLDLKCSRHSEASGKKEISDRKKADDEKVEREAATRPAAGQSPGPKEDQDRPDPGPKEDRDRPDPGPKEDRDRPDPGPKEDQDRPDPGPKEDQDRPDPAVGLQLRIICLISSVVLFIKCHKIKTFYLTNKANVCKHALKSAIQIVSSSSFPSHYYYYYHINVSASFFHQFRNNKIKLQFTDAHLVLEVLNNLIDPVRPVRTSRVSLMYLMTRDELEGLRVRRCSRTGSCSVSDPEAASRVLLQQVLSRGVTDPCSSFCPSVSGTGAFSC